MRFGVVRFVRTSSEVVSAIRYKVLRPGTYSASALEFDLDVDACRHLELCDLICCVDCRVCDVDESLMSSLLELLS